MNQTISFSDFVGWNHKKHNMRFGVDVRRVHADSIGGTNALGVADVYRICDGVHWGELPDEYDGEYGRCWW